MPDFKGIAKGGWHPSWDNKVSINRNNYKDPRAWRKNEDKEAAEKARSHESAPLSSLRDPSTFAPPPKNINYYNEEAEAARQAARPASSSSSARPPVKDTRHYDTARGGLGAPISAETLRLQQRAHQQEEEEDTRPKAPPTPYRTDTTGLRTDHLPPPPKHRDMPAAPPSLPARTTPSPAAAAAPKPRPPPRLPQRQNSDPNEHTPPAPPPYHEATASPPPAQSHIGFRPNADQVSELQSRFSNMRTGSSSPKPASSQQPLSFSRASSAFSTAQKARADPSSVSLAQAKDAASTAAQVHRQYGAQIGAGLQAAGGSAGLASLAAKKKPAPPPPGKSGEGAPPPVPTGSKPRF